MRRSRSHTVQSLAAAGPSRVALCSCDEIHLTLGKLTVHLDVGQFDALLNLMLDAKIHLDRTRPGRGASMLC